MAVLALTTALLARYAEGWVPDNRIASWVQRGEAREQYEVLVRDFGGDEFILLRLSGVDAEASRLGWADGIGSRIADSPAVSEVLDPLHLPGAEEGPPALERLKLAGERPLSRVLGEIDRTGDRIDLLIGIVPEATTAEREGLVALIDELRSEAREREVLLWAAGHPLVTSALDAESGQVERVFSPLLVVLSLLVITIIFRSLSIALAVALPAALASVAVRAALRAIGWPSNMILVAIGPIVFVIVLASLLHLVSAFRRERARGTAPIEAARRAWRRVLEAALLAAGTTAVGFGVFVTSGVEAVSRLGLAVAVGIAIATPTALWLCRLMLAGLEQAPAPRRGRSAGDPWRRLAARALRRRWAILSSAGVIFALAAVLSFDLSWGTNALDYFPAGHPVREQFLGLEEEGAALSTIELIVEATAPQGSEGTSLEDELAALPGVRRVIGPELVRRDVEKIAGLSAGLLYAPALRKAHRVSPDGKLQRWSVFTATGDAAEMRGHAERVERVAKAWCRPSGASSFVCGSLLGTLEMQTELISTLVTSLGLTVLVTGLLFLLILRSLHEFGAAMVTNLFPVALVLLVNRLTFAQIDAATVMVTAVVLGLAVDNTFHILLAARHREARPRIRERLRAFQRVGEPALVSTLSLTIGFAALASSGFAPTARFGFLVSVGVAAALCADLLVLPALWLEGIRNGRATGRSR